MLKAWVWTIAILVFFIIAYFTNLFEILSNSVVKYTSFALLVFMLIMAGFILGNPFNKGANNDKDEE